MSRRSRKIIKKHPSGFRMFCQKHKKAIWGAVAGICGAALITSVIIFAIIAATAHIPYNIRFSKYIEVPQYMGITLKNEDIENEVERQIKALLLVDATYKELKEGTIEEGYQVTIDTKAYILKSDGTREDKEYTSGALTDYVITDIGNHVTEAGAPFSSEIQNAIIGSEIKDNAVLNATVEYPNDSSADDLKGKKLEFDITVKKVEKVILPEYTDTYVLAKSGFKNIEEFEASVEKEARSNLVWNTIVSNTTVKKFYQPKVDEYLAEFAEPYNDYMEENNITFEKMLEELEISEEEYLDNRDTYAYGLVREEMILYYIARTEDIDVSETEYTTLGKQVAIEGGYSSLKEFEEKIGTDDVMRAVLFEKVKTILVSNAVFE